MSAFSKSEFFWNRKRIDATPKQIEKAVEILNGLTAEQIEAVRLFGRSCHEDGFDAGYQENDYDIRRD